MKRNGITALIVLLLLPFPSTGQEVCPSTPPYAIATQEASLDLTVKLADSLATSSPPQKLADATAGVGFVRAAYAAAAQQAFADIVMYYKCVIQNHIRTDTRTTDEQKTKYAAALTLAAADLIGDAAIFFDAVAADDRTAAVLAIRKEIESSRRTANDPEVDLALFDAALREIDENKTFLQMTAYRGWVQARLASSARFGACGGVVRAALVANAHQIQRVVASARVILRTYLDSSDPVNKRLALALLLVQATSVGAASANAGQLLALPTCAPLTDARHPAVTPSATPTETPSPQTTATPSPTSSPKPGTSGEMRPDPRAAERATP